MLYSSPSGNLRDHLWKAGERKGGGDSSDHWITEHTACQNHIFLLKEKNNIKQISHFEIYEIYSDS